MGCCCLFTNKYQHSKIQPVQNQNTHQIKFTSQILFTKRQSTPFINQYQIEQNISKAKYGKIKKISKIISNKKIHYALKIYNFNSFLNPKVCQPHYPQPHVTQTDIYKQFFRQIQFYERVKQKNMIQMYEILSSKQNKKICLILEFIEKKQSNSEASMVNKKQNNISQNQLRNICKTLLKFILNLHSNNITYQGFHPENILFSIHNQIKIISFRHTFFKTRLISSQINRESSWFLPPEYFFTNQSTQFDAKAIDIWHLGITLYYYYFGKYPFYSQNLDQLPNIFQTKKISYDKIISLPLRNLFESLLKKNPLQRITALQLINNNWINQNKNAFRQQLQKQKMSIRPYEKMKFQQLKEIIIGNDQIYSFGFLSKMKKMTSNAVQTQICITDRPIWQKQKQKNEENAKYVTTQQEQKNKIQQRKQVEKNKQQNEQKMQNQIADDIQNRHIGRFIISQYID